MSPNRVNKGLCSIDFQRTKLKNFVISVASFLILSGDIVAAPRYGNASSNALDPLRADVANVTQDVSLQRQQMGQLTLDVEMLKQEIQQLRISQNQLLHNYNELNQIYRNQLDSLQQLVQAQHKSTLVEVSKQIEQVAEQMQKALQNVEKTSKTTKKSQVVAQELESFSEDYPKTGTSYTVAPGDTLSKIAKINNSTVRDIKNANKISNPNDLKVGQALFIPQHN